MVPFLGSVAVCKVSADVIGHYLHGVDMMYSTANPLLACHKGVAREGWMRARLDVGDGERGVQDAEGQEGAKVLAHQDGVEAHDGDAGCARTAHHSC